MSNNGNASFTSPTISIPIKITGKNTTIKTNLEIPHAALIPKKNNFPKIPNKKIKNNIVNIFCSFFPLAKLCVFGLLLPIHYDSIIIKYKREIHFLLMEISICIPLISRNKVGFNYGKTIYKRKQKYLSAMS